MFRLFTAIRPPAPVRRQLLEMMEGVRGARWQDEDQLHLTLRFIGEVDRHRAEDVAAALGSIHHPRFSIAINGVGTFEKRGKGVIWAGVTPQEQLKKLHNKVDQACLAVGVPPDNRAYLPHITIAKMGRATGPIDPIVHKLGGYQSADFEIDSFFLFESDLTPSGPIYSIVERYMLDSPYHQ